MSGASDIVLWLEEEKLSALRERNISVEAELQTALETLYCQSVPQTVREEIQRQLDAESARQKAEWEARTVWAVYHVIQHGEEQYCRTSGWRSYRVRDVCAAACRAFRKRDLTKEQRWERLLDRLDGRELTPDTKLEASSEICSPTHSDTPVM